MQKLKLQFKINYAILPAILLFAFLIVGSADAAEIYFSSSYSEYGKGDIFRSDLNLDTGGELVNACDIKINFNPTVLEVLELSKGDSVLTLWPQDPFYSNQSGQIYLIGGIPGGFNGKGKIVSIIFRVVRPGSPELFIKNDSKLLLNDGMGTEAKITIENTNLNISSVEKAVPLNEWDENIKDDQIPPEQFIIKIGEDPAIFEGKYFIVFSTIDAGTGVDHYEIKEGDSEWKIGNSPYLLNEQDISNKIFVKAVDKAGNERISEFAQKEPFSGWPGVIILAGFLALLLIKKFKKPKSKNKINEN
jgi:hypothetical protein